MTGEWISGHGYYSHPRTGYRVRECSLGFCPSVRTDALEKAVIKDLFIMQGNPAAIERAIKQAMPDCDKALDQQRHLEEELAKNDKARNRVLDLIAKDALTDAQAETKLRELKERDEQLRAELDKVKETLADLPYYLDAPQLPLHVYRWDECIIVEDAEGGQWEGGNDIGTWVNMRPADRQKLLDQAFAGRLSDGRPAGVYLTPTGGARFGPKSFSYQIRGRLVTGEGRVKPRASC